MSIENIKIAKEKIKELEEEKIKKVTDHRNTVSILKEEKVNEKQLGSSKRTETFNENLGPIEEELRQISDEISKLRQENDLQQKPEEILKKRIKRLEEIAWFNTDQFLKTEIGQECYNYINNKNRPEFEMILSKNRGIDIGLYVATKIKEYRHLDNNKEFQEFDNRNLRILSSIEEIEKRALDIGIPYSLLNS